MAKAHDASSAANADVAADATMRLIEDLRRNVGERARVSVKREALRATMLRAKVDAAHGGLHFLGFKEREIFAKSSSLPPHGSDRVANIDMTDVFCRSPEAFFAENIVVQRVADDTAGVIDVRVVADDSLKIGNMTNGKVCMMVKARPGTVPSLSAYWCPYLKNTLKSAMLGDDALYAFTPTMDGCSIGLGTPSGGSQMLAHVNAAALGVEWEKTDGLTVGRARQSQSQLAQLQQALGTQASIIGPADYRPDGTGTQSMSSTTFGVHALGRPWRLYTLTYRKIGATTYFHGGVK